MFTEAGTVLTVVEDACGRCHSMGKTCIVSCMDGDMIGMVG